MLRKPEDMKEWQREALKEEPVVGQKAPEGIPTDDLPEVPQEAIPEVKPKRKPPQKKPVVKKTKVEE